MNPIHHRFLLLICCCLPAFSGQASTDPAEGKWIPAWVCSQQLTEPHNLPPEPGLAGNTLRQVIQPKLAGTRLRVVFSNEYGNRPLTIAGARVAVSRGDGRIDPDRNVMLTFSKRADVVLQPGTVL